MMTELFLGVVADDFTGASDAASFLVAAGIKTVLFNGVPKDCPQLSEETEAVVVALKSRTMPKQQAVSESMEAFRWLRRMGARQLYLKYCSTFDSTAEGNIGPVADAVLEEYGIPYTVLCPSLPVNGRTVQNGNLYVNGVLLEESHMKDHPLTPMWDSYLPRLMEAQSKYPVYPVALGQKDSPIVPTGSRCYLVPDYYEEKHGDQIAEAYGDLPFLTGGSGLVGALGRRYRRRKGQQAPENDSQSRQKPQPSAKDCAEGRSVLFAGSCSAVTLQQIAWFQEKKFPTFCIDPKELLSDEMVEDRIWSWIQQTGTDGLVYSSASPEGLKESQKLGRERVAQALEQLFSCLAIRAVKEGCERIIVAGGETSGAVTKALGYEAFYIGESVAPGVPVMTPLENPKIRLVLKSGNFGTKDFFERALDMTRRKV